MIATQRPLQPPRLFVTRRPYYQIAVSPAGNSPILTIVRRVIFAAEHSRDATLLSLTEINIRSALPVMVLVRDLILAGADTVCAWNHQQPPLEIYQELVPLLIQHIPAVKHITSDETRVPQSLCPT